MVVVNEPVFLVVDGVRCWWYSLLMILDDCIFTAPANKANKQFLFIVLDGFLWFIVEACFFFVVHNENKHKNKDKSNNNNNNNNSNINGSINNHKNNDTRYN